MDTSALGNRMKYYERMSTGFTLMPCLPICVRIDGKGFSRFTKGLKRPYDSRFRSVMNFTTKELVKELSADVGYTQSDEITLIFLPKIKEPIDARFFGGKLSKYNSVIASMATYFFQKGLKEFLPEKLEKVAYFDCRTWNVPSTIEAINVLQWRQFDAIKNSIIMAACTYFGHKRLLGKNTGQQREMLFSEKGINWNDYPVDFKRGAYFAKRTEHKTYTKVELESLPPLHNARKNPSATYPRNFIKKLKLKPLNKYSLHEKAMELFNLIIPNY